MPCYDSRTDPSYVASEVRKESEMRINELSDRLNAATRAACELLRLMPGYGDGAWDEISPQTIRWCKAHQRDDRKRSKKRG